MRVSEAATAVLKRKWHALPPLPVSNYVELVANHLRQQILLGVWPAGYRLSERAIARELGVSRETLRQAIQLLAREGLIEQGRERTRAVVVGPSRLSGVAPIQAPPGERDRGEHELFEDLHALRELFEKAAAHDAATKATYEHILCMTEAQNSMRLALLSGDRNSFRVADTDFHLAIADASGNEALREEVRRLRVRMFDALDPLLSEVNDGLRSSIEQHEAVLLAIQAQSPKAAVEAMCKHLNHTRLSHAKYLDECQKHESRRSTSTGSGI